MRLDLQSDMQYQFYLQYAQYAGIEVKTIRDRLGSCRQLKANMGLYAGGNVAAGLYIDFDEKSPTFEHFREYKPHADIVRKMFRLALVLDGGSVAIKKECDHRGLFFPAFPPNIALTMYSRSGLRFCKRVVDEYGQEIGFQISRSLVQSILTNPAYIGKPIRSGKILENIPFPVIVEPDLFLAIQKKLEQKPKRRGKTEKTEPHVFHGILFCQCQRANALRPVYYSDEKKRESYYKCACSNDFLDNGVCFYVTSEVIIEPIEQFVLQQIAFPEVTDQVKTALQDDMGQSRARTQAYRRERQRIQGEIENLRHNFSVMRLDSEAARMMTEDIEQRIVELSVLETKEKEVYSEQTLSQSELEFVTGFLANLSSEWPNVSRTLKNRLFNLILKRIEVNPDGDDFMVDIHWQTGQVDTLWIEKPVKNVSRKPWDESEIALLRQHYPTASLGELMQLFPDKSIDTIRAQANRQKLYRQVTLTEPWTDVEDEILRHFAAKEISYKQMRTALRHRRQNEVTVRLKKLDLRQPDVKKIYWRVVNTSKNEPSSAIRC